MFFCFFNDTATTEIYTYGHTLSLHYALPICKAGQFPARSPRLRGVTHQVASAASIAASISAIRNGWPETLLSGFASTRNRSEEHTSELQSLMRISYAVFCLKTTNTNRSHTVSTSSSIKPQHTHPHKPQ